MAQCDSIFVKWFGFPAIASFYFILLFTHCTLAVRCIGEKTGLSKSIIGIRLGLAFVFNSRKDNKIISKCIYSVLGISMDGQKEILGTWISENESASFYASICSDLKNRGVTDIFVACHDNLTGLNDAIKSIFPKTKNQLCIVHQIRTAANLFHTRIEKLYVLT